MERAIQIARGGLGATGSNPMVGAVIVGRSGKIIGEGFHRKFGEAHAEVNAINSVESAELLKDSTMYVTLEPCSHYGKTPPCANLIVEKKIPRVVVGCLDPNPKVAGQGLQILREKGIAVYAPFLEEKCLSLNPVFFTAHIHKRPYIILKWAQTSDGYIDLREKIDFTPLKISNSVSSLLVHRLRSMCGAIMVGSQTVINDNPQLDTRFWSASSSVPRPIVADRRRRIEKDSFQGERNVIFYRGELPLEEFVHSLYENEGITSLLVEGGSKLLSSFLNCGLYDEVRIEVANDCYCPRSSEKLNNMFSKVEAPPFPPFPPENIMDVNGNKIYFYKNTR